MEIRVIGVHRVSLSDAEAREAMAAMRGDDSSEIASRRTKQHLEGLRLIEIEVSPANATIDWSQITQPIEEASPEDWQAPYDEECADPARGRWVFFFHFLDESKPLITQVGDCTLPAATPAPAHLRSKRYDPPS